MLGRQSISSRPGEFQASQITHSQEKTVPLTRLPDDTEDGFITTILNKFRKRPREEIDEVWRLTQEYPDLHIPEFDDLIQYDVHMTLKFSVYREKQSWNLKSKSGCFYFPHFDYLMVITEMIH